ncbi:MAG: DUF1501 domain-containing protein, partial [Limisphaerales bacterium]
MPCNNFDLPTSRREFLQTAGGGFGALALASLESNAKASPPSTHHLTKAKNVIFLFMAGGPSHLDTFDRKPLLNQLAGQSLPDSFKTPLTAAGEGRSPLLNSPRNWQQYGQGGLWISDWFPHVAQHADDLAVIHSCASSGINHAGGVCSMNTGAVFGGRPSLGAWASYGLGTANRDLPAFVVIKDSNSTIVNGVRNWGSGFMPAVYQGVEFKANGTPIKYLANPKGVDRQRQRDKLDLLASLNRDFRAGRESNTELEARIRSYELAYQMQAEAPGAVDLGKETEATRKLYGLGDKRTATFGRNCLLARRLVESGVRFVQLYSGAGSKWDSHTDIETKHPPLCQAVDQPIAGLL